MRRPDLAFNPDPLRRGPVDLNVGPTWQTPRRRRSSSRRREEVLHVTA
jgi:hypothetical protein